MQNEVVIARYSEGLDWISDIPANFDVIIYNKGPVIESNIVKGRATKIVTLANSGRESDTIIRHILAKAEFSDGFTVFLQGSPFDHSPDLIKLLAAAGHWAAVQPLSWGWLSAHKVPPEDILARETSSYISGARVRTELFSLLSWMPVQFFDPGAKAVADLYRQLHDLAPGANIAGDFLQRCEWEQAGHQADCNLVGRFSYGALFAVRQDRLAVLPRRSLELALQAANGHWMYGYILERLWLHLMGEPFILSATDPASSQGKTLLAPGFIAPDLKTPPYLQIVPKIKRRIGRWAQS